VMPLVTIPAENSKHGGPMIAPGQFGRLCATSKSALIFLQVFMCEAPGPFDIDNLNTRAAAAGKIPGSDCIHAVRPEITLMIDQIRSYQRRLGRHKGSAAGD